MAGMISDAFSKGLDLAKKEWKEIFRQFLKVNLLAMAIMMLAVLVGGAVMFLGLESSQAWPGVLAGILVIIPIALISAAASSVSYNILEEITSAKKRDVWGDFRRNILPVAAYSALLTLIMVFVLVPYIITRFPVMGGDVPGGIAVQLAGQFYYYGVIFIVGFVLQFALFELVVARAAIIQSMGRSVGIVKKTFVDTLVFYILIGIFSFIVQLVLLIPTAIAVLVPLAIGLAIAAAAGPAVGLALLAIGILYLFLILVVYSSAKLTATLPISYHYWKMAREIKG